MPSTKSKVEVIDLVSDDEGGSPGAVHPRDITKKRSPRRRSGTETSHGVEVPESATVAAAAARAVHAQGMMTHIDLTGDEEAGAGLAGRPGSASEAESAPARNEDRPDSRSRGQNTSVRASGTTATGSNEPRPALSGNTSAALELKRVSGRVPPATPNLETSHMFSAQRPAHHPGSSHKESQWGAAACSTHPAPSQDGHSLTRPHIISDDDDDASDGHVDPDDLMIDEDKSTPTRANTSAHKAKYSRTHVTPGALLATASASRREPSPFEHLSLVQRGYANTVKAAWGIYPWEVAPSDRAPFDVKLVCRLHNLVRAGCSLEMARELIESQVRMRSSSSAGSQAYVDANDAQEAATIIESQETKDNNTVPPRLPPSSQHSGTELDSSPPVSLSSLKHSASVGAGQPVHHFEQAIPVSPERVPSTETNSQQQHRGTRSLSNEAFASQAPETCESVTEGTMELPRTSPQGMAVESGGAESTRHAEPESTAPAGDMIGTQPLGPNPGFSKNVRSGKSFVAELAKDLIDTNGNVSLLDVRKLLMVRSKAIEEDRAYFNRSRLGRARRIHRVPEPVAVAQSTEDFISGPAIVPKQFLQESFPWPEATSIQKRGAARLGNTRPMDQKTQEIFVCGGKGTKITQSNPVDEYSVDAAPIPPYTSYISLSQSFLAENHRTLLVYPYFDDDQDEDVAKRSLWNELQNRYNIVADELRLRRLVQAEKSWQLRSYAAKMIGEFGCAEHDVLRYFLLPSDELIRILTETVALPHAELLEKRRRAYVKEEYDRDKKRWRAVFDNLPPSRPKEIALAGIFCVAWHDVFKFSFWHVARRTASARPVHHETSPRPQIPTGPSDFAYRKFACRVCHVHNCPFHGAIVEQDEASYHSGSEDQESTQEGSNPTQSDLSDTESDEHGGSSVCSEASLINFKKRVVAEPQENPDDEGLAVRRAIGFWKSTKTHIMEKRPTFFPCSHEGTCSDAKCSCYQAGIQCEKSCACGASCKRRFRGCTCAREELACRKNKACECFLLNRECDPDLCASCGAAEALDPTNRYDEKIYHTKCGNVHIQRNVPKRTLLGQSEVQGFGLYAGERILPGDFIGEYKGELVTKEEASRRGAVYQHLKTNYLFNLSQDQEIDGTRAGNKLRFVNNSKRAPNCEPRVLLCNTIVRIGLFATKILEPGDEMFFDYNYPEEVTRGFWEKGGGQAKPPGGTAFAVRYSAKKPTPASAPSHRIHGVIKKPAVSSRTSGTTALAGANSISRLARAANSKRPRLSAFERQRAFEDLDEVFGDEGDEREDESESECWSDSEDDVRAGKKARKSKV